MEKQPWEVMNEALDILEGKRAKQAEAKKQTTHSLGPWEAIKQGCGFAIVNFENETVAYPNSGSRTSEAVRKGIGIDAEMEANANLIAAAPELLEALRGCLWDVEQGNGWHESRKRVIQSVIAKAEGRS